MNSMETPILASSSQHIPKWPENASVIEGRGPIRVFDFIVSEVANQEDEL